MTRRRLIKAAERLFVGRGFDDASVEAISETAGYSRSAGYSNFDNKEEVLLAFIDRGRPKALDDKLQQVSEPAERVGAVRELSSNLLRLRDFIALRMGIQPKANARSFCAERPRRTPAARTRNLRRFREPVSWRDSRSYGSPAGNRRACICWPLHTAWEVSLSIPSLDVNTCIARPPSWCSIA